MAIYQCKICGGDLDVPEGSNVGVCEYCGTKQTVGEPPADTSKPQPEPKQPEPNRSAPQQQSAQSPPPGGQKPFEDRSAKSKRNSAAANG